MKAIDKDKFIELFQASFGQLQDSARTGLLQIVYFLENDDRITDLRHAAYALATARHETTKTYLPVREIGKGQGLKYGKPDPVTGQTYYGRGYVQLTWKDNYAAMGKVLQLDLVNVPDLALKADVAYRIMSYGMRTGAFTGVGLSRFIHDEVCDFLGARKIINGTDCADRIAAAAEKFLTALKGAQIAEA